MTKYDAFIIFINNQPDSFMDKWITQKAFLEEFEIAWESGQFNEEPKGECCK